MTAAIGSARNRGNLAIGLLLLLTCRPGRRRCRDPPSEGSTDGSHTCGVTCPVVAGSGSTTSDLPRGRRTPGRRWRRRRVAASGRAGRRCGRIAAPERALRGPSLAARSRRVNVTGRPCVRSGCRSGAGSSGSPRRRAEPERAVGVDASSAPGRPEEVDVARRRRSPPGRWIVAVVASRPLGDEPQLRARRRAAEGPRGRRRRPSIRRPAGSVGRRRSARPVPAATMARQPVRLAPRADARRRPTSRRSAGAEREPPRPDHLGAGDGDLGAGRVLAERVVVAADQAGRAEDGERQLAAVDAARTR